MTSNFSNNSPKNLPTSVFKKHHVHEVATSLTESKTIASNYAENHRYQHRAVVVLFPDPTIKLFDPIYLDGLPNNMSGYWTVLSITHRFGGRPANYLMELEVGTDIIGDVDPAASTRAQQRDIQSDLAGQSLTSSGSSLSEYKTSPNLRSLVPPTISVPNSANVGISPTAVPAVPGTTPNKAKAPNNNNIKKNVQWASKTNSKVVK